MSLGAALTTDINRGEIARYTLLGAAAGTGAGMVADMAGLGVFTTAGLAGSGGGGAAACAETDCGNAVNTGLRIAGDEFQQLRAIANQNSGGHAQFEEMHWVPKAFQEMLQQRFQGISSSMLRATDALERGFHKVVHGKWGTLEDAYNSRVGTWLRENPDASLKQFEDFIGTLKVEYLEQYQQYLTGN